MRCPPALLSKTCALVLLVVPLAHAGNAAAAEAGVLLRDVTLHAEPGGAAVAELARGGHVGVHGRQGLWLLVTAATAAGERRGWTRLMAVRLGSAVPPAGGAGSAGGGFAAFSRSVSGLLGGLRGRDTRTANATIGIRGLTPSEITTARFDAAALARVAAAQASAAEARAFAAAGGVVARSVPEPAATAASAP